MRMLVTQAYEFTATTSAQRFALPRRIRDLANNTPPVDGINADTIAILRSAGSQLYVGIDRDPTASVYDAICLGTAIATYIALPPHAKFVSMLCSTGTNLVTVDVGWWAG